MAHPPCKYAIFRGLCPFNYAHLYIRRAPQWLIGASLAAGHVLLRNRKRLAEDRTAMAGSVVDTTTRHLGRDSSLGRRTAMATPRVDITRVLPTDSFTGRRTAIAGPVVDTTRHSEMDLFTGHRTAIRDTVQRKTPAVVTSPRVLATPADRCRLTTTRRRP